MTRQIHCKAVEQRNVDTQTIQPRLRTLDPLDHHFPSVTKSWRCHCMELGQWVIWVIFHVRVTGSSFSSGVRPEFFGFSKKKSKIKI